MSVDKQSSLKLGMIATGVVSGVLLVLYLPVLIWSPPWSENGSYIEELMSTKNGYDFASLNFNNGKLTSICLVDGTVRTLSDKYIKQNNKWYLHYYNNINYIIFNEQGLRMNNAGVIITAYKTSNPLTIWYIKCLEWTAD